MIDNEKICSLNIEFMEKLMINPSCVKLLYY